MRPFRAMRLGATMLLIVAPTALSMSRARADESSSEAAIAEQLYQNGRRQMAERNYQEACDSFAESLRHDPGTGALLNLASCHEALGRVASAWDEFHTAADAAKRESRLDRVHFAEKHIVALEARLPYLTIEPPPSGESASWRTTLDGKTLGAAAWRTPIPVDPGRHEIIVTGKDGRQWQSVYALVEGQKLTVTVPIQWGPPPAPPRISDRGSRDADAPDARVSDGARTRRTLGLAVGGAGVAAILVGGYFGIRAFSLWNDRTRACPLERCTSEGVARGADADRAATVANWSIGVGAAAMIAGGVLLVWPQASGVRTANETRRIVAVGIDPSGRVGIGGTF